MATRCSHRYNLHAFPSNFHQSLIKLQSKENQKFPPVPGKAMLSMPMGANKGGGAVFQRDEKVKIVDTESEIDYYYAD